MKAKSIEIIRSILKKEKQNAYNNYRDIRRTLEENYKTKWLEDEICEAERQDLHQARERYDNMSEVSEDFEKHDW